MYTPVPHGLVYNIPPKRVSHGLLRFTGGLRGDGCVLLVYSSESLCDLYEFALLSGNKIKSTTGHIFFSYRSNAYIYYSVPVARQ